MRPEAATPGRPDHEADLALALRLADAAGRLGLEHFRRPLRRRRKADGSLVTEVDERIEDEVRRMIGAERPGDAVLGEERGGTRDGARRWIIDAIDGTHFFAEGSPDWATLIALEIDGRVACGVCEAPAHGRRYWAARGIGAYCTEAPGGPPRRLTVSATRELGTARTYVHGEDWWRTEWAAAVGRAFRAATRVGPAIDHPAIEVAAGTTDASVLLAGGPWDYAALVIIVEEAGGRFTDLDGVYTLDSGHALFSNGLVHDALLELVPT